LGHLYDHERENPVTVAGIAVSALGSVFFLLYSLISDPYPNMKFDIFKEKMSDFESLKLKIVDSPLLAKMASFGPI
jgi:hypothetical protein